MIAENENLVRGSLKDTRFSPKDREKTWDFRQRIGENCNSESVPI